jgi:formate-dependent nitrite reductase membrane component NrfD
MTELTWGPPLFFDLWAAGMAAGGYFAAFMLKIVGVDPKARMLRTATYIGVPLVFVGVLLIIVDLGEPLRAFNMYLGLRPFMWQVLASQGPAALRVWPPHLTLNVLSPMSLGGWVLVLYIVTGLALIVLWLAESLGARPEGDRLGRIARRLGPLMPLTGVLAWVAFALAILVMAYTGVVLAVSSMALWSTTLLIPALFVLSATLTGVAVLLLVVRSLGAREPASIALALGRAFLGLIVMQAIVLVALIVWLGFAGLAGPLILGDVGIGFWLGAIVLGLLAPLALETWVQRARSKVAAVMLVSPILALLGGLALRATIIVAGQI